jgi:hypothetical protein
VVLDQLTELSTRMVPVNHPIGRGHVDGFALVAELDAAALYRLYGAPEGARGQIDEGPGPFDCLLADLVPQQADGAMATLACVVPRSQRVFAGMPGIMSVRTGSLQQALLLPLEAVAGDAVSGTVLLVQPGTEPQERAVTLGISDGNRIAVTSGLREGDTVRVPGPDLGGRS